MRSKEKLYAVMTTINSPTRSVIELVRRLEIEGASLVVAGDSKGPPCFQSPTFSSNAIESIHFLSLEDQRSGPFELGRQLPTRHYSRKNIAYLAAIAADATCIYETDDDNAPTANWQARAETTPISRSIRSVGDLSPRWVNAYSLFSSAHIWPRGIPLDRIKEPHSAVATPCPDDHQEMKLVRAPIQQGLVNGSPDVDAIWRLTLDSEFEFNNHPSVEIKTGNWCPFNTQSTWWWPAAFPLLYIPSYCTFRMCDIWKSFVAQRCLWELNLGVVFHGPEVYQDRNPHSLMKDFEDEIPGYLNNHRIAEILEATSLQSGEENVCSNFLTCYESLVREGIFPEKELELAITWLADLAKCQ